MNYIGIDIHKRYSVCVAQNEQGQKLGTARIEGNTASGFAQFFQGLGGESKVVIEACWNWGKIHDLIESQPGVAEVLLANPLKTRLIASAQIKTDKIDANTLATLLRGNLVARAHAPAKAVRQRKDTLRQRLYWARLRTRIRNRIHAVLQQVAALGIDRGRLGRRRLLPLLRHLLPASPRSGQKGQHGHRHRRPPHVPDRLSPAQGTTPLPRPTRRRSIKTIFPGRSETGSTAPPLKMAVRVFRKNGGPGI